MSSMLEEAIIDATALREAARKNAEEKIIEHFSGDIKSAMERILEQDMMGGPMATMAPTAAMDPMAADPMAMDPMAAAPAPALIDMPAEEEGPPKIGQKVVAQLPYAATTYRKDIVSIDLDKLEESIERDLEEGEAYSRDDELYEEGDGMDYDLDEGLFEDLVSADGDDDDDDEEDIDLAEMIRRVLEEDEGISGGGHLDYKLTDEDEEDPDEFFEEGDTGASEDDESKTHPGEKDYTTKKGEKLKTTQPGRGEEEGDKADVNESLIRENKQHTKKLTKLNEQNNKYRTLIQHLKEEVQRVNLSNAKLLYQNRVLDSASLNERQKDRLVETITNAKTVEEAKIIYETLQSAVGASVSKRKSKSLNEVVTKRSSAFMPRKEEKKVDTFSERMKILAGLK